MRKTGEFDWPNVMPCRSSCWRKLPKIDTLQSRYRLAKLHYDSKGVEQYLTKARSRFQHAAESGS